MERGISIEVRWRVGGWMSSMSVFVKIVMEHLCNTIRRVSLMPCHIIRKTRESLLQTRLLEAMYVVRVWAEQRGEPSLLAPPE